MPTGKALVYFEIGIEILPDMSGFAHPEAAIGLGDRQPEGAELGHGLDDPDRDQRVVQVPLVGIRFDPFGAEAAELVAHETQGFVQPVIAETIRVAGVQGVRQTRGERDAGGLTVAKSDQCIAGTY